MAFEENLERRLRRLEKWSRSCDRVLEREAGHLEDLYRRTLSEWETRKRELQETLLARETQLRAEVEQAGKDYAKQKYQMERQMSGDKEALKQLEFDHKEGQRRAEEELRKMNEEKLNAQISHDRQMSALRDLYQEKRRHLAVTRATLQREWQAAHEKLTEARQKAVSDLDAINGAGEEKIRTVRDQGEAKRYGWGIALEAMTKQLDGLSQERCHLEKRVTDIRGEKENELDTLRSGMALAREQLEVDKATLIEKAEEDQRLCEREVEDLRQRLETAERDLQELLVRSDTDKKSAEERLNTEETQLKDVLKTETERRDYEQKVFEQEKAVKEKEIFRLREDYEKKKWQWDNQVRGLLMQKSLQDSEHEAERLRVDREARTSFRSLEAKRDELKQRLSDLKSRHAAFSANAEKEKELIAQRWNWRKERLWSLWQSRLEVVRKERKAIQDQLEALLLGWNKERQRTEDIERVESSKVTDLQSQTIQSAERMLGIKRQREIQFELEKTRLLAQIKECESLISEWNDRMKRTQDEMSRASVEMTSQTQFLDRWYRDEEQETQLFLRALQDLGSRLNEALSSAQAREAEFYRTNDGGTDSRRAA